MKKYEGMFLVDSETASKKRDEIITHIRDTVQKHQGEVLDLDRWDDRRLAYEIKKHRKGAYFLGHFKIPPGKVNSIRDEFLISDTVLRHMFIVDTGRAQFLEDEAASHAAKPARKEHRAAEAAPKEAVSEKAAPKEAIPEERISEEKSPDTAEDTTPETPEEVKGPTEEEKTEAPKEPTEE